MRKFAILAVVIVILFGINVTMAGEFNTNPRDLAWQVGIMRGNKCMRVDLKINFYPEENIKFWVKIFPSIRTQSKDEQDAGTESRAYFLGEFGPGLMGITRSKIIYDLSEECIYHCVFYCEDEKVTNLIPEQERSAYIGLATPISTLAIDDSIILGEPFEIKWDSPEYKSDCSIEIRILRPNITTAGSIGMAYSSKVIGEVLGDKKSFKTILTKEILGDNISRNSLLGTTTDYFYKIWITVKRTVDGKEEYLKGIESKALTIIDLDEPVVRWPPEP